MYGHILFTCQDYEGETYITLTLDGLVKYPEPLTSPLGAPTACYKIRHVHTVLPPHLPAGAEARKAFPPVCQPFQWPTPHKIQSYSDLSFLGPSSRAGVYFTERTTDGRGKHIVLYVLGFEMNYGGTRHIAVLQPRSQTISIELPYQFLPVYSTVTTRWS